MKDDCINKEGMIVKPFRECEKCDEFPCIELTHALNGIINGEE